MVCVHPTVIILITGDDAATYFARFGQRSLQIKDITLFIPATVSGGHVTFEFSTIRMLTYHVDIGRRVACTGHQTRRAAYHFNAVIDGGIGGGVAKVPDFTNGGWKIVVGVVADKEAT